MSFEALFTPRGVVVAGSVSTGKLGYNLVNGLVRGGCKHVYAVNPKAQGLGDVPGFASAQEIGKPLDLVVVASPAATVKGVLEDCGKAGVKAAIIISSGFSEAGHPELEEEVKEIAAKYGIRYTGPNCAGMINTHSNLFATLEASPPKGRTALISQSGAVGGSIMAWAEEQGLGFSKFVSYGNGSDLNELEFLKYLSEDPDTDVIAMYVENIKHGRDFMSVLKEVTRKKPVVMIKSGRTSTGQRATLSHTGSMAGADSVYDAALKECGALRVKSIEEMFDLCKGLVAFPEVKGNRLLIVTNSGGPGVMTTDLADEVKLDVAEPSAEVQETLRSFLPAFAGVKNPVDLTVEGTAEEYRRAIVEALVEYDAAIALYIGTPYLKAMPYNEALVQAAKETGKPVASILQVGADIKESIAAMKEAGLPSFLSGERAAWVISRMLEYHNYLVKDQKSAEVPEAAGQLSGNTVLEPEGMSMLKGAGIPVPEFRFVTSEKEAKKAAKEIGFPVVVKVVSPDIIHKSDFGGVKVNLKSEEEVGEAFRHMQKIAEGLDFRGVIIYPLLAPGTEVIIGLTRDVQFGPVVVFGLGGIYSEVLKDISLRIAPVTKDQAMEMIQSIRSYPILKGIRGKKGADLDALAEAIASFSRMPFLYPDLKEADLNPVFAYPDGVVTVDCRLLGEKK